MKCLKYITKIVALGSYSLLVATLILFLPGIFGKRPMIVLSGSMEPTFSEGSLIYMEKTEFEDLHVGDIVSYGKDQIVSHRIVEKCEGTRSLITKGDANGFPDPEVSERFVIGKIWEGVHIPYAGYLIQMLREPEVIAALVFLLMTNGIFEFIQETEYGKRDIKNPLY